MPTDVVMPQMGESITEGTITKWLKKPGDSIQRDEPLFEISTDKVDAEIPSPSAGTLKEIKIAEGATVQINTIVATIDEGGSASAPAAAPAKAETAAAVAAGNLGLDASIGRKRLLNIILAHSHPGIAHRNNRIIARRDRVGLRLGRRNDAEIGERNR